MILNVKLLSGGAGSAASSCDVVAREGDSVESLKRQIEEKLRLSSGTEQKLLFKGKTLQGEHVMLCKLQRQEATCSAWPKNEGMQILHIHQG